MAQLAQEGRSEPGKHGKQRLAILRRRQCEWTAHALGARDDARGQDRLLAVEKLIELAFRYFGAGRDVERARALVAALHQQREGGVEDDLSPRIAADGARGAGGCGPGLAHPRILCRRHGAGRSIAIQRGSPAMARSTSDECLYHISMRPSRARKYPSLRPETATSAVAITACHCGRSAVVTASAYFAAKTERPATRVVQPPGR